MVSKQQHTIVFQVDNLKSTHEDSKVNNKFKKWLQDKYGEHGKVKAHRGVKHDYLGMLLHYSKKGKMRTCLATSRTC